MATKNKSLWLNKLDREREFVARRPFTYDGTAYVPGDPFDTTTVTTRRLRQLFDKRMVVFASDGDTGEVKGERFVRKSNIAGFFGNNEDQLGADEPGKPSTTPLVPDEWRSLDPITLKAIASKIKGERVTRKDEALKVIEEKVKKDGLA